MTDDASRGFDDRARDAADHLQAAMRELIAAGHSLLGAFEDVVERREPVPDMFGVLEAVARRFIPPGTEQREARPGDDPDDDPGDGYEPIPVD